METNLSETFDCPICIETLQKPIRMLGCGHNFCHPCLARLCQNNSDKRCPKCRRPIELPGNRVEELPQNYDLESAIEELKRMKITQQPVKKQTTKPASISELRNSAATYQQQSNFQNAVETLRIIIDHVDGWDKLQPSIDLAECLLDLGMISEAKVACVWISSIVDASPASRLKEQSRDLYDDNIKKLILKFVKAKECDWAISLARCRFQFVKNFYDGESRSDKLQNVGWLMIQIAKEMKKQNKQTKLKEQYSFLEEILEFMQNTNDVDLKKKCEQTAWFLKYFGICCSEAADWSKSIIIHQSTITLMKTVFNVEANKHVVFGDCHNNMGVALSNSNQLFEAKVAFTKAIEIYNTATDWASEEAKTSSIRASINHLECVESMLP